MGSLQGRRLCLSFVYLSALQVKSRHVQALFQRTKSQLWCEVGGKFGVQVRKLNLLESMTYKQ